MDICEDENGLNVILEFLRIWRGGSSRVGRWENEQRRSCLDEYSLLRTYYYFTVWKDEEGKMAVFDVVIIDWDMLMKSLLPFHDRKAIKVLPTLLRQNQGRCWW